MSTDWNLFFRLFLCCSWKTSGSEEDLHPMDQPAFREGLLRASWSGGCRKHTKRRNSNSGLHSCSLSFHFTTWLERDNFFLLLPLHPKARGCCHEAKIAPTMLIVCFALQLRHVRYIYNSCSDWIIHVVMWHCLCAALKFHLAVNPRWSVLLSTPAS